MVQKLLKINLSPSVVQWVFNYLTNQSQFVSLMGARSAVVWTNMGGGGGGGGAGGGNKVQYLFYSSSQ